MLQVSPSHSLFLVVDLPVWSISGPSVPWCGEFSSTWERDKRLKVIKSLLNYLMQDELACLPAWLSS